MSSFTFKEFTIHQSNAALKVGSDAMLLGASINSSNKRKCLDIGAGTGVLSLMVAQKNPEILVDAIEIDFDSITDLQLNFNLSKWSNRLKVISGDFLEYSFIENYDLIISNPPFYETKNLNQKDNIARAKHESNLPFEQLFSKVAELLTKGGIFYIIMPNENANKWKEFALQLKLNCIEEITLFAKPDRPKRSILSFSKVFQERIERNLIVRNEDNSYTKAYKDLTFDFHSKEL